MMMARRSREPFFWAMFSGGGMLAALFLPALVLVLWFAPPSYQELVDKVDHPLVKLALFGLILLSLFHWGHRFRYTLYDGLQLSHLYGLIATICYGGATALTILAGYLLWTFP